MSHFMAKEIETQRIAHIDSDQCCLLKAEVCKEELSMLLTVISPPIPSGLGQGDCSKDAFCTLILSRSYYKS